MPGIFHGLTRAIQSARSLNRSSPRREGATLASVTVDRMARLYRAHERGCPPEWAYLSAGGRATLPTGLTCELIFRRLLKRLQNGTDDRDRQAEKLWPRAGPSASRRRTSMKLVFKQPHRELASTNAAARAADARFKPFGQALDSLRPLVHRCRLPVVPTTTRSHCLLCDSVR